MRIKVVGRSFFEARLGTRREATLLQRYSIISTNSIGLPEKPPFSRYLLTKPNLLILRFDDVDEGFPNAMTDSQAQAWRTSRAGVCPQILEKRRKTIFLQNNA